MEHPAPAPAHRDSSVLIVAIFIAGLCSIVYELLIGSVSSYFLGDSIKQFSLTIGLYMAAMGAGAFLSRLIQREELARFISLEIVLGLLGGLCVPLLYACYAIAPDAYPLAMIGLILLIGLLIGFEIPLLTRLLERYYTLKVNISNVLGVDYLGALTATLLFPFVLLPFLGTFRSSLLFGIVNMGIGFLMLHHFGPRLARGQRRRQWTGLLAACGTLVTCMVFAAPLARIWSQSLYEDRILFEAQTPYQKIVLTRYRGDVRLFLNGNLQFSSRDEYRYHEALVHLPLAAQGKPERILVLGGGDGLAVREILKHGAVRSIVLVDLDPAMTNLARTNPLLRELNGDSLDDPRVAVVNADGMRYLDEETGTFDVIIADLPDPNNASLARLYSREFYKLVRRHLRPGGVFVTQSTSPYYARDAFWCIHESMRAAGFTEVTAYHAYLPSFGDWGFNLGTDRPVEAASLAPSVETRFLSAETLPALFVFPADTARPDPPVKVSSLDRPEILPYYLEGWRYWR